MVGPGGVTPHPTKSSMPLSQSTVCDGPHNALFRRPLRNRHQDRYVSAAIQEGIRR